MKEIWKPIPEYETRYEVSNFGRVKRTGEIIGGTTNRKPGYILKPSFYRNYFYVALWAKGSKVKWKRLHRIVAKVFVPNPLDKPQVNHLDCNKINNRSDNLQWVTIKENAHHAFLNGRYNHMIGTNNINSKLTPKNVIEIRKSKGVVFQRELAKKYGVSTMTIIMVQKRRIWKQVI